MALATKHLESSNWWGYGAFYSVDFIWEEILMILKYKPSLDSFIEFYEKQMFEKYNKLIEKYYSSFNEFGCSLKLKILWNDFSSKKWSEELLKFHNGYECYICCEVNKNDSVVKIISNDGEADFYILETSFIITSIERHLFKSRVKFYPENPDVDAELKSFIKMLNDASNAGDGSL